MKIRSTVLALLFLALFVVPVYAVPIYNIYLRLGTIQGNVDEREHKQWIEVVSMKGLNRPTESGAIVIRKYQDDASTPIFANCTAGTVLPDAVIEISKPVTPGGPLMTVGKFTLNKVTIKEANTLYDKTMDSVNPLEEITLAYDLINWETRTYRYDGTHKENIKDSWNNATKAKI